MAKIITNLNGLVANAAGNYISANSNTFKSTIPGPQGLMGPRGPQGASIKGDKGEDLTIEQIIYDGNGVFTWHFSDESTYTTPSMTGPQGAAGLPGVKGDRGISVHHLKPTNTTEPHGKFAQFGEIDTYTFYGDAEETIVLGYFKVGNGIQTADEAEALGVMTKRVYDEDGDGIVDDSTRLGGKTLAEIEAERTAEILAAQLALGTNYTVADNAARLALTDLTVGDKVFVSDDGDGRWAQYWVTAVTDGLGSTSTFEAVMDEDSYLNANTAGSIKAAYESNLDTNAFTDAEKTLVDVATPLDTTATTLPGAVNELHSEIGTTSTLTTAATDLASAVNELDGEIGNAVLTTTATEVKAAINELDSEIGNTPLGTAASTLTGAIAENQSEIGDVTTLVTTAVNLAAAVNEVYGELDAHITDTTDAHDASAISYVHTTSGLAAVNVQAAIDEVEARVDLADTHRTSDGSDHTFINQDVTTTASPTFANVITEGLVDGRDVSEDGTKLDTIEENAKDDQVASEVPVTPVGSLVADNVQTALEDLHTTAGVLTEAVEKNTAVTGTSTLVRYDKILGNLDVVQMGYTGGDLTAVRYFGDNNTDSFYRDVLVYSAGNLTSIKHYYNKPDLVTESAVTVLVYDVDSNLISTQYTEL